MKNALLTVEGLSLDFKTRHGLVKVLEDISFAVEKGEMVGIVGESGSGKSVLSYAMMGLLGDAADIRTHRMEYAGVDLTGSGAKALRGRELSMIFQSPRTALNPIRKIGHQIGDVLARHGPVPRGQLKKRAIEALARVRIPDPERRYHAYPFELSGGMCQRVMIAMALASSPGLLIADEPTTGLDVTTQAIVVDLIRALVDETRMGAILITHDLALAGEYCDRILVMHAGHLVEVAPTAELFSSARHPYTRRLFSATPQSAATLDDLAAIPGNLPDLSGPLLPCRFAGRCPHHQGDCDALPLPPLDPAAPHGVRCHHPENAHAA
ncbi:ABC transporter ATP-binding protein [Martelella sp. HB161492]|uniref:ABC transporter ATP-binding protein n=1 Tax=Martelella sp. HB161492 TaxID=2720726 RepID=UPI00159103D9|nr:ABC transporter ATP-binding protein [Martelella sp. HB161492]